MEALTDKHDKNLYAGLNLETIWGTAMKGIDFPKDATPDQRFYIAAAALSMSTANGVYDYYKDHEVPHDLPWITDRLARTCSVVQHIWKRASELNQPLYDELTMVKERILDEDNWRELDRNVVPSIYYKEISPTGTAVMWGLPRMLMMLDGIDEGRKFEQNNAISESFEELLRQSKSPEELMCKFGEYLHKDIGFAAPAIMEFMLKAETIYDQDSLNMYAAVVREMSNSCPELWKAAKEEFGKLDEISNDLDHQTPGWLVVMNVCLKDISSLN